MVGCGRYSGWLEDVVDAVAIWRDVMYAVGLWCMLLLDRGIWWVE
jgi:hypothetical protein